MALSVKPSQLPEIYRHWLTEEVNYVITDAERQAFSAFLQMMTETSSSIISGKNRTPDINSPTNTGKEEHYRRLSYAERKFAMHNAGDGWRTDRGMVYITLEAWYTKYLRQMEIWFYHSLWLPSYFSLIFFKPSYVEDYRLYSPNYCPEKLIASSTAVVMSPAVRIIREDLNTEVEHLSFPSSR